jgi:hypothetical protein
MVKAKVKFLVEIDWDAYNRKNEEAMKETLGNCDISELLLWRLEQIFGEDKVRVLWTL